MGSEKPICFLISFQLGWYENSTEVRDVNGDSVIQGSLTRAEQLTPAPLWGLYGRLRVLEPRQSSGHGGACLQSRHLDPGSSAYVCYMKCSQQKSKRHGVQRHSMEARCPRDWGARRIWSLTLFSTRIQTYHLESGSVSSPPMMLFFCLVFPTERMLPCPFLYTTILGWVLQSTFKEWAVMLAQTSQEWKISIIYLKLLHKRVCISRLTC